MVSDETEAVVACDLDEVRLSNDIRRVFLALRRPSGADTWDAILKLVNIHEDHIIQNTSGTLMPKSTQKQFSK